MRSLPNAFYFLFFMMLLFPALGAAGQTTWTKSRPCSRELAPRQPVSDLMSETEVLLSWDGLPEAEVYRLRLGRVGFASLLLDTFLYDNSLQLEGLPGGKALFFDVQAQCANGQLSAWANKDTFALPNPDFACGELFVDIRDGKYYRTVQMGDQCWFQQNLNHELPPGTFGFSSGEGCNAPAKAGRFYNWTTTKQIDSSFTYATYAGEGEQGICPAGWHVPTKTEFSTLLADTSITFSSIQIGGGSGFELHLGGYMNSLGNFTQIERAAFIMTSSSPTINAKRFDVVAVDGVFASSVDIGLIVKTCRGSVRCLLDD